MKMEENLRERVSALRKEMTVAERKLWSKIRRKQLGGLRFRRQVPLGSYIVDFACFDPKIIIEIDGSQHANQIYYDETRTKYLQTLGYVVLRFWNNEVLSKIENVLQTIYHVCIPPSGASHHLPPKEEGSS